MLICPRKSAIISANKAITKLRKNPMTYKIEFEDHGQDLLTISCDENTGEIIHAGPFHNAIYADGNHFIDVEKLYDNRMVWYARQNGKKHFFKWPMVKLERNGEIIADATAA